MVDKNYILNKTVYWEFNLLLETINTKLSNSIKKLTIKLKLDPEIIYIVRHNNINFYSVKSLNIDEKAYSILNKKIILNTTDEEIHNLCEFYNETRIKKEQYKSLVTTILNNCNNINDVAAVFPEKYFQNGHKLSKRISKQTKQYLQTKLYKEQCKMLSEIIQQNKTNKLLCKNLF